jgi:curved DNA-binding protein
MTIPFKDYYQILGVEPDSDLKAIKTAYRKLARQYHPDVSEEHNAEKRFKEITEAYEVLKDTTKRAEYDELRLYGQAGKGFEPPPGWQSASGFREGSNAEYASGFSDFFNAIFGAGVEPDTQGRFHGFTQDSRRGQDIETDLAIFLEDTLSDCRKSIAYELPHRDAQGRISRISKNLNVTIPAGVMDGERIRLLGQGAPGVGDAASGDLYLRIRLVPHPLFDVEGHDLVITVPLAPWEAALGAKVTVPTLDGHILLNIPPRSQTGKRMRIKSKGLVSKHRNGDLYAVLKVVMPVSGSSETDLQWQKLAESTDFDPRAEWGIEQ